MGKKSSTKRRAEEELSVGRDFDTSSSSIRLEVPVPSRRRSRSPPRSRSRALSPPAPAPAEESHFEGNKGGNLCVNVERMEYECANLKRRTNVCVNESAPRAVYVCEDESVNVGMNMKKKRMNDEIVMDEERVVSIGVNEASEWRKLKEIGNRLRGFLLCEANKVSKYACETILGCVSEYEGLLGELLCENASLKGRVNERECMVACLAASSRPAPTFAGVVAGTKGKGPSVPSVNATGVSMSVPAPSVNVRPTFVLVVKGKQNESTEQVREKVLKSVNGSVNVRVRSMRPARNGGIVIETVSESERECLRKCDRLAKAGLNVEEPRAQGPRVIVYDVPNEMTSERFLNELYDKNVCGLIEKPEFCKNVRVIARTGKKEAMNGNVILEVSD